MSPASPISSTIFLVSSLLVLGAGPLLFVISLHVRMLLPAVDGFVLGAVGTLVLFFLLPQAVHDAGPGALLAAVVGLGLLSLMEKVGHIRPERAHRLGLALALCGLLLHTALDGLAVEHSHGDTMMGMAVVIHRLPVAIAIWWLVRPRYGRRWAVSVLAAAGLATTAGFLLGENAVPSFDTVGMGLFNAFVAGALVHVILHGGGSHSRAGTIGGFRLAETVGGLVGVLLVALLPLLEDGHASHFLEFGHRFLELALESAPALLIGYLLAGAVVVVLPRASTAWLARGGGLMQAMRGTAFGLPIPICSCGVVPLYQSLITRGAPGAAAIAFLVATPELGIESMLLSLPLLGTELTVLRIAAAVMLALGAGWVLGARFAPASPEILSQSDAARVDAHKLRSALRFGLVEVPGDTAAWILAGLAIAAAVDPAALDGIVSTLPRGLDVVLAAVAGIPLYVCASGATPLAAALIAAGLSPGAAVAFLLAGPATNVTTFGVLARLHGPRSAAAFGAVMVVGAVGLGALINLLVGIDADIPVKTLLEEDTHGPIAWGSLVVLVGVFAFTLFRQGPARFFAAVFTGGDGGHSHQHDDDHAGHHHDHDHDHDHGDDHDHGHAHAHDEHDHHGHDHDSHDHDSHDHEHGHRRAPPPEPASSCGCKGSCST